MNIFERILTALGLRKKEKIRIVRVKDYDKDECERALVEAEKRLGMTYAGRGIAVVAKPGKPVNGVYADPSGKMDAGADGGRTYQTVYLWVGPNGRESFEIVVHEMAHAVLFSHGTRGHPAQYRRQFLRWYD